MTKFNSVMGMRIDIFDHSGNRVGACIGRMDYQRSESHQKLFNMHMSRVFLNIPNPVNRNFVVKCALGDAQAICWEVEMIEYSTSTSLDGKKFLFEDIDMVARLQDKLSWICEPVS